MNLIKITKRDDLPKNKAALIRILSVVLSIVFAGLIIAALGYNPITVFSSMLKGALGTKIRLQQTTLKAVPLIITSLGILVAFKMKFWNIGGEGQIIMGAFAATFVALHYTSLPKPVLLLAMAVAAMVMGGIWAFIPAYFKAKMGTNETIFTLMLNYIAVKFVTYLQYGPWRDPSSQGFPKVTPFGDNAILPNVGGVHIGWIIALLLVVVVHIFINHTKKGYEITVVGESTDYSLLCRDHEYQIHHHYSHVVFRRSLRSDGYDSGFRHRKNLDGFSFRRLWLHSYHHHMAFTAQCSSDSLCMCGFCSTVTGRRLYSDFHADSCICCRYDSSDSAVFCAGQ